MSSLSKLRLAYHRRFLLCHTFGRNWRASLYKLASEKGVVIKESSLSHVVAADWRSRSLLIERIIAGALGLPFDKVWPEYARELGIRRQSEGGTGGEDPRGGDEHDLNEVGHGDQI